jgi:hypothetical protein
MKAGKMLRGFVNWNSLDDMIFYDATIEGFGPRKWYLRREIDRRAFGMRMQIEVKIIELNSEVSVNYKIFDLI